MFTLYHQTRASLQAQVARIYTMENNSPSPSPITPENEDLDDRTVDSDQAPAELSKNISNMAILNMSDIRALDEAPTATRPPLTMSSIEALDEAPTAAVHDVPETASNAGECGSVIQSVSEDGSDESWIPVPNVIEEIMVEVVASEKSFFIEKNLLCSKSSYFKTALNSGFMEAHTNRIPLGERLNLFQIFHYWLKQGNLDFMDSKTWSQSAEEAFVKISGFADRRGVPALADLILCKLDRRIRPGGLPVRLTVDIIALAWEQLPESSKLCHYLVAIERDANKCNLPKRPAVDYESLPGGFVAALLSATENSQWWTAAMVQQQRVDIAKVHKHIKSYGGLIRVDPLRRWDAIIREMGIRAPVGCDQDKLRGQFRAMTRRWLRPWDTTISRSELASAEEECSRPLVRQFLHSAASRGR